MLIKSLVDYYDFLVKKGKIDVPYGWSMVPVSYILDLTDDGKIHKIKDVTQAVGPKGKKRAGTSMAVPMHSRRGNAPLTYLLCDNAKYIFGLSDGEFDREPVQYTKDLHHKILDGVNGEVAKAILAYVDMLASQTDLDDAVKPLVDALSKGANILISVNGVLSTMDSDIGAAYNDYVAKHGFSGSTEVGIDLVTGERGIICRIHNLLIKHVNAAPNGAALCFSNAAAFEPATGGKQGYGFPMTEKTAYKYATALNHLTASKHHNLFEKYSGVNIITWSQECEEKEQEIIPLLATGAIRTNTENGVDGLTEYIGTLCDIWGMGVQTIEDPDAVFHIVGLDSKDGYSIRVRFEYVGTARMFMDRIRKHYADTAFAGVSSVRPVSFQNIMNESVTFRTRDVTNKRFDKRLALQLLQSILEGEQYPLLLVDTVIHAIVSDINDNYEYAMSPVRLGFLRGYLNRLNDGTTVSEDFDGDCEDLAYLCGRATVIHERLRALYAKNDIMESDNYAFTPEMLKMPNRMMNDLNETIYRAYYARFKNSLSKSLALHYISEIRNILDPIYPESEAAVFLANGNPEAALNRVPVTKHLRLIGEKIPDTFSRRDMAMFLIGYVHEKYHRPKESEMSMASDLPASDINPGASECPDSANPYNNFV